MMRKWTRWGLSLIVLSSPFILYQMGSAEGRYTVQTGDPLYRISQYFGPPIERLEKFNGLEKKTLNAKQALMIDSTKEEQSMGIVKTISFETESYTVKTGDSLYTISKKVGISVDEIKRMNYLNSSALRAGQVLIIGNGKKDENIEENEELGDIKEATGDGTTDMEIKTYKVSEPAGKWDSPEERGLLERVAKAFLGVPYRWEGNTLKGLDCSAFVKKVYQIFSINLPRTALEQLRMGKKVRKNELEVGDLVFFNTRHGNGRHVGIYVGKDEFVHSSYRKKEVRLDNLNIPYFKKSFLSGVRLKKLGSDMERNNSRK